MERVSEMMLLFPHECNIRPDSKPLESRPHTNNLLNYALQVVSSFAF